MKLTTIRDITITFCIYCIMVAITLMAYTIHYDLVQLNLTLQTYLVHERVSDSEAGVQALRDADDEIIGKVVMGGR